jgi:hypothetical protein
MGLVWAGLAGTVFGYHTVFIDPIPYFPYPRYSPGTLSSTPPCNFEVKVGHGVQVLAFELWHIRGTPHHLARVADWLLVPTIYSNVVGRTTVKRKVAGSKIIYGRFFNPAVVGFVGTRGSFF